MALSTLDESWANHHHPWRHPCLPGYGVLTRTLGLFQPHTSVLQQQRRLLSEAINDAQHTARYLRINIAANHLRNRHLRRECLTRPLLGVLGDRSSIVAENWLDALSDDFHRLALLIAYVYEANMDALDYSSSLQNLLLKLRTAACHMKNTATLSHRELYFTVRPSSVPEVYRGIPDQARQDRRNCLIARVTHDMLNHMSETYDE